MGIDLAELRAAVAAHGPLMRVVVAGSEGSAPREAGAAMLVWEGGQSGTIGGGALEHEAAARARARLAAGAPDHLERVALGPALGQCCGGAVRLLFECFGPERLAALSGPVFARPVGPSAGPVPGWVAQMQAGQAPARTALAQGWMTEPLAPRGAPLWIWGAGHVGRALMQVLAPLPGWALTWVDVAPGRFPAEIPPGVQVLPAARPEELAAHAPHGAGHLVLTYSHELDLALCHALLLRGFAHAGLIGSATKWARFRKRLRALGHSDAAISRIACPIGDPALGKHPQAIAVGVAAGLLKLNAETMPAREGTA